MSGCELHNQDIEDLPQQDERSMKQQISNVEYLFDVPLFFPIPNTPETSLFHIVAVFT